MEWMTLISALSGGILGVGSTLVVESVRSKRERAHAHDERLRQIYADYLLALTETDGALQILATTGVTPVDRNELTVAFRSKSLLASNYQVFLVAPRAVAEAAEAAYVCLRDIREILASRAIAVHASPEWEQVHRPYDMAVAHLREAMREDVERRSGRSRRKFRFLA